MNEIIISVYKAGYGSDPITLDETKESIDFYRVKCKNEKEIKELLGFIESGVHAFEDWKIKGD